MTSKQRKPLFDRLSMGLEQCIAHTRGELTLRTTEIPEDPPEIDGRTLAALRGRAGMSQAIFAKLLNVSTKTLQSWEQGVRQPSDASRRLIQVFSERPEVLSQMVGLGEVKLEGVKIKPISQGRRKIVVERLTSKLG